VPALAAARASSKPKPLTAGEFAKLVDALLTLGPGEKIAVAVSGGADSMALALLSADWAKARGLNIAALTVDHGLRPDSAAEARQVGAWLGARGIEHHILRWRGAKPAANRQALAREARYHLLGAWCRRHGARRLLLGHQLEDQAETFLLRAGRGSGVDGLAAMAAVGEAHGLMLARPLLTVEKARLVATLRRAGQAWIEDPSNRDPHYQRTQVRAALELLAPEGLGARRLAATAGRMARVRQALEAMTAEVMGRAVRHEPLGYSFIDAQSLARAPEEIALRVLARVLADVGGHSEPMRLERLERLLAAILGGELAGGRTLAGCRVLPWKGAILVCREASQIAPALKLRAGQTAVWDGRFELRLGAGAPKGLSVAALGRRLGQLRALARAEAVPGPARPTLPTIWRRGRLVLAPLLKPRGGNIEAGPAFEVRLHWPPGAANRPPK
jgi:tRNA(Ile)-lysidine synthase